MRVWRAVAGLLALLGLAPGAAAQATGTIRVRITNPPRQGSVRIGLYDSDVTFGRISDPVRVDVFPADGRERYELTGIPAGEYALVAHHDEDGDGLLDKNFIGIPNEPIAISRGYRPKGPPVYARARFDLPPGGEVAFQLELRRVLGEGGLFGVGVGALSRSQPYVGADAGIFQPIPAVTFNGDRLQWFGPSLRYGLASNDTVRLAATATFRLRAYDEEDSPAFAGLGDRSNALLAGLALVGELPLGVNLALGYEHDLFDTIGGGVAQLEARRTFQRGITRVTPSVGLNWTASELADHDFGVPLGAALPGRPAYDVDDYFSLEVGLGGWVELTRNWRIIADVGVEFLPSEVRNSPIVDGSEVVRGFLALSYGI